MSFFEQRAARIGDLAQERGLDLLLVTNLVNVRYLSGFTGTNGICLVGAREERVFVTDFRYVERARSEVPDFELVRGKRDLLGDVAEIVKSRSGEVRLGFDDAHLTVRSHARLEAMFDAGVELVPAGGLVEQLRARKDEGEVASIRAAAAIADDVYRWLIDVHGLAGHSELQVARALERRAQDCGAEAPAFPPIVAAAANGALPHAVPGDAEVPRDSLVVVDFGCAVDGYRSDCTRTFATGDLDDEAREVYELVRSAQEAAGGAVRTGVDLATVDGAAREVIERAGRGEQFGHGVGHGVGLEVHEAPRMAPDVEGKLEAGNVVTVEPGVYVPGKFGVRIEDLEVVTEDGAETLTSIPKELITV